MMFALLEGWHHVEGTDRRAAVDCAHILKDLAGIYFAKAKTIGLVQDNLRIHSKEALYEAFPAAEAWRPVERFERLIPLAPHPQGILEHKHNRNNGNAGSSDVRFPPLPAGIPAPLCR
jgi:hypothetical protein